MFQARRIDTAGYCPQLLCVARQRYEPRATRRVNSSQTTRGFGGRSQAMRNTVNKTQSTSPDLPGGSKSIQDPECGNFLAVIPLFRPKRPARELCALAVALFVCV